MSLPRALSKLGLCSRTQAFDYIASGRVSVNGRVSKDASLRVSLEHDRITVDGKDASESREPIVIARGRAGAGSGYSLRNARRRRARRP